MNSRNHSTSGIHLCLILITLLISSPLLAQLPNPSDDLNPLMLDISTRREVATLPSHPINMKFLDNILVMCMGLQGTAWIDQSPPGSSKHPDPVSPAVLHVSESHLTLDFTVLSNRYLVTGDRSGILKTFDLNPENPTTLNLSAIETSNLFQKNIRETRVEGQPIQLDSRGNLLAVAAGGAGVSFWTFDQNLKIFSLASRYPFTDYVRDVTFLDDNTVAATDVNVGKAIVLDISDPMKPELLHELSIGGQFYDRVFGFENQIVTYSRTDNVMSFTASDDYRTIEDIVRYANLPSLYRQGNSVFINDMDLVGEHVLVLEKNEGVSSIWLHDPEFTPIPILGFEEPHISMAVHPSGKTVYFGTISGKVWACDFLEGFEP